MNERIPQWVKDESRAYLAREFPNPPPTRTGEAVMTAHNFQRYQDDIDIHTQDAPHPGCDCDTCHDARAKNRRNALPPTRTGGAVMNESWSSKEANVRDMRKMQLDPPPVNVRAEQVHRIRQKLVNVQASCGTRLDVVDRAELGQCIVGLIDLERDLRD